MNYSSSPPEIISLWYQERCARENVAKPRTHFNASETGSCPRRLCYQMSGTPGAAGMGGWLLGRLGKHLHAGIEQDFIKAFGAQVETEVACAHTFTPIVNGKVWSFAVRARIDLFFPDHGWVADIKTMASNAWSAFVQGGIATRPWFRHYLEQMNLYAAMLEALRGVKVNRVWVVPVDREKGDYYLDRSTSYPVDPSVLMPVWERWATVLNCLTAGEVAARPYQRPGVECSLLCGYREQCWRKT